MPSSVSRARAISLFLHRWVALVLVVLLVPISVSGGLLVWHDHVDWLVNPSRYAVSGEATLAPSAYLASATAAVDAGLTPAIVRFPESPGWPVTVMARGAPAQSGPPRFMTVYLDPPTAKVLEVVDARASLIGVLHRFHENLTIPQWNGRQIVGWAGVGMLLLSLTGIWIWWPRNGFFLRGLRWSRSPSVMTNLHHMLGFWISVPLAVVSLTGVYLGFPQTMREAMSSVAAMSPSGRPGFSGQVVRNSALTSDAALDLALASQTGATPAALFLPTAPGGGPNAGQRPAGTEAPRGEGRPAGDARAPGEARPGAGPSPVWRVQLRLPTDEVVTVLVDDRSQALTPPPPPLAGDRAAQWIRWIHEGSNSGVVWQALVFLTGVFPTVFAITGIIMWWRVRRARKSITALRRGNRARPDLQPAE